MKMHMHAILDINSLVISALNCFQFALIGFPLICSKSLSFLPLYTVLENDSFVIVFFVNNLFPVDLLILVFVAVHAEII